MTRSGVARQVDTGGIILRSGNCDCTTVANTLSNGAAVAIPDSTDWMSPGEPATACRVTLLAFGYFALTWSVVAIPWKNPKVTLGLFKSDNELTVVFDCFTA